MALLLIALAWVAGDAHAYRPFDGTDAAVAGPGEFELELGPLGSVRQSGRRSLVAPAVTADFGLSNGRELVVEGQHQTLLNGDASAPKNSVVDTGVFIKDVLRDGALQDKGGPSIATEIGILLPEQHGESGTGFSAAAILSQRYAWGSVHLNSMLSLTRTHRADAFLGVIAEGPNSWTVRPVAEIFGEQQSGGARTVSRLVGAIWRVRDNLSFDIGIREAHEGSERIHEVRLGLTWAMSWDN